ncbi:MAG: DUF6044 family protein [Candidatus Thorarchaeota archaeon]
MTYGVDMISIRKTIKDNYQLIIGLIILVIDLAPYYIFGYDTNIGIHDAYDSTVIWYEVLAESGMLFAPNDAIVPGMMNGLPRICYGSEFFGYLWLFLVFDPYVASLINITLGYFIGFTGMYLLLKKHFLTEDKHEIIRVAAAVCFGLLQFRPCGGLGLTVPTGPLAVYAFLNIRKGSSSKKDWAVLLLIPFVASIVYGYFFLLSIIGLLWLVDIFRKRRFNKKLFGSILMMGILFLLVEYRLVIGMLLPSDYVSHRMAFVHPPLSLPEVLKSAMVMFLRGQYHAVSLHGIGVLLAIVLAFGLILFTVDRRLQEILVGVGILGTIAAMVAVAIWHPISTLPVINGVVTLLPSRALIPLLLLGAIGVAVFLFFIFQSYQSESKILGIDVLQKGKIVRSLIAVSVTTLAIALWFGVWQWSIWVPLKDAFEILRMLQFHRFYRLGPMLWYALFALALAIIQRGPSFRRIPTNRILVFAIIVLQISIVFPYNWSVVSMNTGNQDRPVTYREFYAEGMFTQIRDDIGLPQEDYKIINIGIHPVVAQHNDFHTLDGYINNYPLEYKLQFRNIISHELAKNEDLKTYFDHWGSRCYTFVAELDGNFFCTKEKDLSIENLELNITALHEMNCSYVFSAVEIQNLEDNSLSHFNTYEKAESTWRIYVYEVY